MASHSYKTELERRELTKKIDMATKEYNEGFMAGQDHRTSSPETKKKLHDLYDKIDKSVEPLVTKNHCNNNVKTMSEEIKNVRNDIKEINKNLNSFKLEMVEKIGLISKELLDETDKRYAPKWVLGTLVFIAMGVGGTIVTAVMNLILK